MVAGWKMDFVPAHGRAVLGGQKRVEEIYAQRPADKRPVWVIRPDGSDAHAVECLRFQCAMDGSRAAWKP